MFEANIFYPNCYLFSQLATLLKRWVEFFFLKYPHIDIIRKIAISSNKCTSFIKCSVFLKRCDFQVSFCTDIIWFFFIYFCWSSRILFSQKQNPSSISLNPTSSKLARANVKTFWKPSLIEKKSILRKYIDQGFKLAIYFHCKKNTICKLKKYFQT